MGRRDDEWPGWVGCETQAGVGGWMPERLLDKTGCALNAYTARELTVQIDEELTVQEAESGWVPASHLVILETASNVVHSA